MTMRGEPARNDERTEQANAERTERTIEKAAAPAGAAAGALAGGAAGLATGVFGPFGALVGAIVGAVGGTALGAGAAGTQGAVQGYSVDDDAAARESWDAMPNRPADRSFESVRPAFQFGHLAARHQHFAGRDFRSAEPELAREWPAELHTGVGSWESVTPYVESAYSRAHRDGAGVRRDPDIIGSAGSAVDPVERDRARAGLPSVDEPQRDDLDVDHDVDREVERNVETDRRVT